MGFNRSSIFFAVLGAAIIGMVGYANRVSIRQALTPKPKVPVATERLAVVGENNATAKPSENVADTDAKTAVLPAEVNLKVPFTSQAPHANWDTDHGEFCEEAAVLMVGRYWRDRGIQDKDEAEAALQELKQWELENLGFYYDTTAEETVKMLEGMYGLTVELKVDPTVDDIKRAVAAGKPVIVPSAGRELGNPNFRRPGPIYHMLVIRGYTSDGKFITNDPGTRKGREYVYDIEVVMKAMHDWVPDGERTVPRNGDVREGRRVVLIASK